MTWFHIPLWRERVITRNRWFFCALGEKPGCPLHDGNAADVRWSSRSSDELCKRCSLESAPRRISRSWPRADENWRASARQIASANFRDRISMCVVNYFKVKRTGSVLSYYFFKSIIYSSLHYLGPLAFSSTSPQFFSHKSEKKRKVKIYPLVKFARATVAI